MQVQWDNIQGAVDDIFGASAPRSRDVKFHDGKADRHTSREGHWLVVAQVLSLTTRDAR